MIIKEKLIEQAIFDIENDNSTIQNLFAKQHQDYYEYLQSELFNVLQEEEIKILMFITLVIFQSYWLAQTEIEEFDITLFFEKEDDNWLVQEKHQNWEEASDHFFKDYSEEDLLAFVEDLLVDDEDQTISQAAQEIIFINAKSYIDTLLGG